MPEPPWSAACAPGLPRVRGAIAVRGDLPEARDRDVGRVVGLRAGRRRGRGRVEGHPADAREVRLDPRVGVEVAHDVLLAAPVVAPGREPGGHAGRHPAHAQQERHRAGELLAVALAVREEERGERQAVLGRGLVVGRVLLDPLEHLLDVLLGRGRRRPQPLRQPPDAGVARAAQVVGALLVGSAGAVGHGDRGGLLAEGGEPQGELLVRELLDRPDVVDRHPDDRLRELHPQVVAQREVRVDVAGVLQVDRRGLGRVDLRPVGLPALERARPGHEGVAVGPHARPAPGPGCAAPSRR